MTQDIKTDETQNEITKKQVAVGQSSMGGFAAPQPSSFKLYREMRANPTISIARSAATAPIRAASWGFESRDANDLPRIDEAVDFVRDQLDKHRSKLLKHLLTAYDFGFSAFEKVFKTQDDYLVIDKLKPLLPDITKILENKENGALLGVEQGEVKLYNDKVLLWSYDAEPGNHYGRSRNENIRLKAYRAWQDVYEKQGKYISKVAGVIPMVEYEPGVCKGPNGEDTEAFNVANDILNALGSGSGVAMPRVFSKWSRELIQNGANIKDLQAWSIRFLETTGAHGADFINQLRYYDSLLLRGWLVPERSVVEGQFGTKAEAGQHASLAIAIAELDLLEIAEVLNKQIVDQLLVLNFGEEYCGKVVLVPEKLAESDKTFLQNIVASVMNNPVNADLVQTIVDLDAAFDVAGVPKLPLTKNKAPDPQIEEPENELDDNIAASLSRFYEDATSP